MADYISLAGFILAVFVLELPSENSLQKSKDLSMRRKIIIETHKKTTAVSPGKI